MSEEDGHAGERATGRGSVNARLVLLTSVLAVIVVALLQAWRGESYWNYSEGVYALSAHLFAGGAEPYRQMVFAQPPGTLLFGGAALAIHDSIDWLRLVLGLVQGATGLVAARAVWRMTGSAFASAATVVVSLLTPWAVHEHGALTPELFAAPLLLAGVLSGSRPRGGPLAGVLAALAPAFKLPYAIPALVVVALARDRRAAARWAAAIAVLEVAGSLVFFGTGVWRDTVLAQAGTGLHNAHGIAGYWAQEAWTLAPLLALGAFCLRRRARTRDARLVKGLAILAASQILLLGANVKAGTSANIVVPAEACLVPLAVTGAVLAWRAGGRLRLGAAVAAIFIAAQTGALFAAPQRTTSPFLYPGARGGSYGETLSDAQVAAAADRARRCPDDRPYGGTPYIAFVAGRHVPDDQPDGFLTSQSATLAPVLARIRAVRDVCPP